MEEDFFHQFPYMYSICILIWLKIIRHSPLYSPLKHFLRFSASRCLRFFDSPPPADGRIRINGNDHALDNWVPSKLREKHTPNGASQNKLYTSLWIFHVLESIYSAILRLWWSWCLFLLFSIYAFLRFSFSPSRCSLSTLSFACLYHFSCSKREKRACLLHTVLYIGFSRGVLRASTPYGVTATIWYAQML